jgi:DNA polymerase
LVVAFREGRDVYKIMASAIYGKPVEEIDKAERFMGKTVVLGCGYGLGATKFRDALKMQGVKLTEDEAANIIRTYRETYPAIVALWRRAQLVLEQMLQGTAVPFGCEGVLKVVPEKNSIRLPSGLYLPYRDLRIAKNDDGKDEYQYKSRYGWNRIYGGKVVENVCQAVARCIIGEQMILIAKRYEVTHTVHDAIACIVPEDQAEEAQAYVEECMRWVPAWAEGLPVNCESGYGRSYGEC